MPKTVYVVNGSEDGLLGVYGNVKAAYRVAKDYLDNGCGENTIEVSYKKACKELRNYYTSVELATHYSDCNASITSIEYNKEDM